MRCDLRVLVVLGSVFGLAAPAWAETVTQQCSQQYQAAKAAGTLNGMTWNKFRSDCSAKLKAQPASATAAPAAPAAAAPAAPAVNPLNPAPAPTPAAVPAAPAPAAPTTASTAPAGTAKPVSPGRAAFQVRQKECGAEWRANKATLVAQTPGLTWPKYLSQCNARLKAAGK